MKEYFSHDHHARTDEKIIKMLKDLKPEGYGLYWMIVEMLHENQGSIPKDYELLAYELRTQCERIKAVCENYDLFYERDGRIFSMSVDRRLQERSEKSVKAKASAIKRWGGNANAMPTQCERIDDHMRSEGYKRKVKERKEKGEGETDPPTVLELREYAESEQLKADPQKFHDYQTAKGTWKTMVDWKAAFRYWNRTEHPDKAPIEQAVVTPHKVWMDTAGEKTRWSNSFHDKHTAGGKCMFCGRAVKAPAICDCSGYSSGFAKHMESAV